LEDEVHVLFEWPLNNEITTTTKSNHNIGKY